jgi:FkbM family methyltransferase
VSVALVKAHGFLWPRGGHAYGQRYIRHAPDMEHAIKHVKQRRVVVQAGGHVGVWPKWLASRFEQVYTFEPQADNFEALMRNVKETNVVRLHGALGDAGGAVGIRVSEKNIGGHRVIPGGTDVTLYRIDDLRLEHCDLIVLDVEGYELHAIRGAVETLDQCSPVLMFEDLGHIEKHGFGSKADLVDLLSSHGYRKVGAVSNDVVWKK